MSTLSIAEVGSRLESLCDDVAASGEPVIIERGDKPAVMLMPVRTGTGTPAHLLDPAYMAAVLAAGERARNGESMEMTVDELRIAAGIDANPH